MTTALEIITHAAKLIGVVRKGESLSADEGADGLVSLNDMLESWAGNGLLVPYRTWENFTVVSATSYTIGSGATLNTVRPLHIVEAFFRIDSFDYPLTPLTDEEFQRIDLKTLSTGYPEYYNYDNGYANGTIRLYPQGAGALHLLSEKPLTALASLSTSVTVPQGWKRMLRFNLAVEMAGEYGIDVPPRVEKIAKESMDSAMLSIAKNRIIKKRRDPSARSSLADITAG